MCIWYIYVYQIQIGDGKTFKFYNIAFSNNLPVPGYTLLIFLSYTVDTSQYFQYTVESFINKFVGANFR